MEHNKQESMKISAVRLYENGFMTQPFAFGGEGMEGIDPAVKYRSSLQNFVIAENGGLYYMFHGDVTYTDEALYANKLSVVFEDIAAARKTLDAVREFIRTHPTVYLSTHTPLGYENLEAKAVVDLNNPPESKPVGDIRFKEASGKYVCTVCGYVYDPAEHDGIAFEDLPDDWKCPRCKQGKDKFNKA